MKNFIAYRVKAILFTMMVAVISCVVPEDPEGPLSPSVDKGITDLQLLEQGPFNLLNPYLVKLLQGTGSAIEPTGQVLTDSLEALNMLKQYAQRDQSRGGMINAALAESIYNNPELHDKKRFYVDGLGIVKDPLHNTDLIMLAAAVVAHKGAETMREFLFSKTPQGLPKVAGIVYSDSLPAGANAQVLGNTHTDQSLIQFKEGLSREKEKFLLLSIMAHEFVHQDVHISMNEERAANILEHLVMLNQVLHHPELFAKAKHAQLSILETSQITQHIAFLNSLNGATLDITGAHKYLYPNANGATALSQLKTFIELVDLLQAAVKIPENVRMNFQLPKGWRIISMYGPGGCDHFHNPAHNHRIAGTDSLPDGGSSPSNQSYDDLLSRGFDLETGGSVLQFGNNKTLKMSQSLRQLSGQNSGLLSPENRIKAMETIGLEVPSKDPEGN